MTSRHGDTCGMVKRRLGHFKVARIALQGWFVVLCQSAMRQKTRAQPI